MNSTPVTFDLDLIKLIDQFHDENKCRAYLEQLRWRKGPICPKCSSAEITRIYVRNQMNCKSCRHRFTVTAGTIFNDSHLPLWKWFVATYLMIESRKGMSANQLSRTLGVSYKTAWYLCHRIRKAMDEARLKLLTGTVEVDETYVGGKGHGKRGRGTLNKAIAIGAIQRGGPVRLRSIEHASKQELHAFIKETVGDEAAAIYTDQWKAYQGIADANTRHETVNHAKHQWVNGDVHTNSVENVWSLLKRSVVGSYHKVSAKHLDAYLNELEWRFNNRKNPRLFHDTMKKLIEADKMPFKELIKEEQSA